MGLLFLGVGLSLPSVALAMMPLSVFKGVPEAPPLLHRVAIIGEESGRVVSNDPNTLEAQIAEASGTATFCNKAVGTANLVKYKDLYFLVSAAHGFYKKGKLRCANQTGWFYPDLHYGENSQKVKKLRKYKFRLPPLNHHSALKDATGGGVDKNIYDLVVIEIEEKRLLWRQVGGKRKTIRMLDIPASELRLFSLNRNLFLISRRTNFKNFKKASFEKGCKVSDLPKDPGFTPTIYHAHILELYKIRKHNCDTGGNSSGSSLSFIGKDNEIYSLGIHYAGQSATDETFKNQYSVGGNFFIPSEYVIKALDEALLELQRRENARLLSGLSFDQPYGKTTLATSKGWRQVQTVLVRRNFYRGKIDGKLGPKTSRALYNYLRPLMGTLKQSATLAGKRANSKLKQNDKSTQGFGYNQHTDSDGIDVVTKGHWKTQNGKKVFTGYYTTAYREGGWKTVCYHYRKISTDNLHAKLCLTPTLKIGYHTRFSINLFNKKLVILGSSTGTEMELQSRKGKDKHLLSLKEKVPLPDIIEFKRAITLPTSTVEK